MYAVSFMAMAIPGLTVAAGFYIYLKKDKANAKRIRKLVRASVSIYVVLVAVFLFFLIPGIASAESSANSSSGMGFLAAALSTGISAIAAGYAVAVVGSSAIGAISEDPNIVGKTIIFVGLAEGIAIYGLIVSIMILGKI
ncbi:MAG: ATPase [Candidatus Infernicultor aquiphilus]|jgi:V/A-type H+/Na+-transporting ATPase subunit K|uniref:ATPase n=1 Tax=Candidatus Infernicultor aquiphilus TaxID=1805029 RepID=A0A1J5GGM2_9BACT|nr:ATPase [bacterium]OIP71949.1 MAG: ATPase [Candidatus Atribacteria bacterium CG2_30_33_13]PIW11289.1 MAG: ATPase [Candidatus Atribacteria bacterium CG17_big_fil_post_rev_8_21_14_2_50_34_11]PIX34070.1 MAG: ATPase [Candidatus Atribacteria bacterium CG_4_8_14_3_um_filter_34_18]PIY31634.1 MAG: ATPase [Candidatus Atribacteria bacterium CG_4_10_14_3_um_filter_34_13]PJB58146.1 MAG: ATPase [Candidatus Atribacteria bacterium CG_4_9_14_3_um_filter_33_16]